MKRLIIICEGQTEQEFCKVVLIPFFSNKAIHLDRPIIKKSGGGIVHWETLKRDIEIHLKKDKEAYVSTLIDYYGINAKHDFPNWKLMSTKTDKFESLNVVESGMKEDIATHLRHRFIPYIQLHEFEGLLLNNLAVFKNRFEDEDFINLSELEKIISEYPNPELINDGIDTAPSKRLEKHIKRYKKTKDGAAIAKAIGLEKIREKSTRFNHWISILENI